MNQYGLFTNDVRALVNFKLLAHSKDSVLRSIKYQSCYNALSAPQLVDAMEKWPKFSLKDVLFTYEDEEKIEIDENSVNEFIPGAVFIRTNWTENAALKQEALDNLSDTHFPINYYEKPGGLFDTVVVSSFLSLFSTRSFRLSSQDGWILALKVTSVRFSCVS
jgi:hypothetical protein